MTLSINCNRYVTIPETCGCKDCYFQNTANLSCLVPNLNLAKDCSRYNIIDKLDKSVTETTMTGHPHAQSMMEYAIELFDRH